MGGHHWFSPATMGCRRVGGTYWWVPLGATVVTGLGSTMGWDFWGAPLARPPAPTSHTPWGIMWDHHWWVLGGPFWGVPGG